MPRNALDVLAQQVTAQCVRPANADGAGAGYALVTRAGPYRELSRAALESVLDMLSGRYPSSDFAELRPLLAWDRATDTLTARRGRLVARLNAGTIPDRGTYASIWGPRAPGGGAGRGDGLRDQGRGLHPARGLHLAGGGDHPGPGHRLPRPRGARPAALLARRRPGRPVELGRAIGAFCREVPPCPGRPSGLDQRRTPLDAWPPATWPPISGSSGGHREVPSDRTIVVERFRDELGDWRVCILTPFGARIHAPWAMALQGTAGHAGRASRCR
jgi:ATP-dependent helicase Lhr and Lhr-like helicase